MPAPALELAAAIREGRTRAADALEEALERSARWVDLGAWVYLAAGRARRQARRLDRRGARSPFHGVPTAVKDTDAVRWMPLQAGSRAYRHAWSPWDGPAARRLRGGGFLILGKTATSELALLPVVETDIHPPCRNPWDPDHLAGGSSGGAAALVAARVLPVAHGSDGGGSIRIPAAWCGLFGHKPSRGLLPGFYEHVDPHGLSAAGGLARGVEDAAAFLDVLAGRDPGTLDRPRPDSLLAASLAAPPARLRVRWTTQPALGSTDEETATAVERVVGLLADAGHRVEPGPPLEDRLETFLAVFGDLLRRAPVLREAHLQPVTRHVRAIGRAAGADGARAAREELERLVAAWWGGADLWVTPTTPRPAPPVGFLAGLPPEEAMRRAAEAGAFTAAFNVGGQAAASIPVCRGRDGLPRGVQLAMPAGRDGPLLALCRWLQERHALHPDALGEPAPPPPRTPARPPPGRADRATP